MKRVLSTVALAASIVALSATAVVAVPPADATNHGAEVAAIAHAVKGLTGRARGEAISALAKTHGAEVSAAARAKGESASAAAKAKAAAAKAARAAARALGAAASEPGRLKGVSAAAVGQTG